MNHAAEEQQDTTVFRVFLAVALVAVVARAAHFTVEPLTWVQRADSDDIMRLLSVRDWLAGQGWFDMIQYRLMPPDGVDMHWTRYIDAAMAGLFGVFSPFLPAAQAENLALVAWPTLLYLALVALTGIGAQRTLGTSVAIFAVLSIMLWPAAGGNFAPYRIDHHNVQILMISAVVFSLILPGPPMRLGIIGGLAGAVSFAVGLEMLIAVGLAGVLLVARAAVAGGPAMRHLLGFAASLFAGSVVLFVGQTPAAMWGVARCDQLSAPYLALTAAAALVAGALAFATPRLPAMAARLGGLLGVSVLAGAALVPLLAPCVAGPYDDLPVELQALLHERIIEARGLLTAIEIGDAGPVRLILPASIATLVAGLALALRTSRGLATERERWSVGVLLVFAAAGLAGSFSQLRLILWASPAVTVLTGYAIVSILRATATTGAQRALRGVAAMAAMLATLFLPVIDISVSRALASKPDARDYGTCRSAEALATLADIAPGIVLAPLDYGAPLLLVTPHKVVAGPYHRSPAAFLNGFLPFEGDEAALMSSMDETGADYLLLCRDQSHAKGTSFTDGLARGAEAGWLEPVDGVHPALLLLKRGGS